MVCFVQLNAQEPCGTDKVEAYLLQTDSDHAEERRQVQQAIRSYIEQGDNARQGTFTIPVVVHVLHLGEPVGQGSNISEAQIIDAIDGLNLRFNNTNGPGTNAGIEFFLAQRSPALLETNGITRVDASGITDYATLGMIKNSEPNSNESALKSLNNWPHEDYYNIWVVHDFSTAIGGFAYFPTNSNFSEDGTTILASLMTGSSSVLAHELGHGLDLYHTFEGANDQTGNCPPNSNCEQQGDFVCDTPPHLEEDCGSTDCGTGDLDNSFRNFMSYCGSTNLFTDGQGQRMVAALATTTRSTLVTSDGCVEAPPCLDETYTFDETTCDIDLSGTQTDIFQTALGCDSTIVTNVEFIPSSEPGFEYTVFDLTVNFNSTAINADLIEWDFGDGNTRSGVSVLSHIYSETGIYEVVQKVSNQCGIDSAVQTINLNVTNLNEEVFTNKGMVIPNPNNGSFMYQPASSAVTTVMKVSVIDLNGRLIHDLNMEGRAIADLSLEGISPGLYFLQASIEDRVIDFVKIAVY